MFDTLKIDKVSYSLSTSKKFPSEFENSMTSAKNIEGIKEAHDDNYLHFAVKSSFSKSKEKPSEVYVSFLKVD